MKSVSGAIREAIFGLPLAQVEGENRGFRKGDAKTRARLDRVAKCVVHAYNQGLSTGDPDQLAFILDLVDPEMRGFAYEGGAMGMITADMWGLRRNRLAQYVEGPASHHAYMAYVGAGLAMGIFHKDPIAYMERLDPFTGWLVLNGYGFCHGFFSTEKTVTRQVLPKAITGPAERAYDAGLGRALWFVDAGQPEALSETVGRFPEGRQPALWAGIGLACVYACGIDRQQITALRSVSGEHYAYLAQGAIMAAHTRHVAGNPTPQVDLACEVLCDMNALTAHRVAERAMEGLKGQARSGTETAWETWLSRLRAHVST